MTGEVYQFADRKTIAEEAREWLIRLDGDDEPSRVDVAALNAWVERSPAHREELLRVAEFWNDANLLTELSIPLQSKPKPQRFNPRVAVAATFLLGVAVALTVWLYPQSVTATNGIYATAIGELQVQTLADGSVIQINTDSQVQVDYSDTVRKIRLLRGEAHFDVSSNPDWPFEVHAGKGMVKAVGTAFSVYLSEDSVEVTVSEGRVDLAVLANRVESAGYQSVPETIGTLGHGQSAVFSSEVPTAQQLAGSSVVPEIDTLADQELARRLSWREGYLVFAGEPLSYVVGEVNRYTPMTIDIADPALSQLRIGGRFKVGELEPMFDVLQSSFDIQVSRLDDQHIRLLPAP